MLYINLNLKVNKIAEKKLINNSIVKIFELAKYNVSLFP